MQMKLLKQPLSDSNLPEFNVTHVLVNYKASKVIERLQTLDIQAISVYEGAGLNGSLAAHADMNYFHYGNNELFCMNDRAAGEWAKKFNLVPVGEPLSDRYPHSVLLNCVRIGSYLICNTETVSKIILDKAYKDGLQIINTKQGFTKCSVCVLSKDSIITDDPSIYESASKFINDVTFISKGSIKLDGYNYGFIGGCTGKISKDCLAFCGRIDSHSDHNIIYDALERNKLRAAELTDDTLEDIGSLIPLIEYNESVIYK